MYQLYILDVYSIVIDDKYANWISNTQSGWIRRMDKITLEVKDVELLGCLMCK